MQLMRVRELMLKYPRMWGTLCALNNLLYRLRFSGDLIVGMSFLHKFKISSSGTNNRIEIEDDCKILRSSVQISGSFNTIIIRKGCRLTGLNICIEDNNNTVILGEGTTCAGPAHLACIEGESIEIGKDVMLSGNIVMRVGDSHSILNEAGERVNPSASIRI